MSVSLNVEPVIVIGSGPAAYSAALYLKEHSPLVLAGDYSNPGQYPGGQLTTTTEVDNYPGFPDGIQGNDLAEIFKNHAIEQGNARVENVWVSSIDKEENEFILHTNDRVYRAKSVIIATGSVANRLYVKGTKDDEYWQKGISACAVCDGWLFTGKKVLVIGGGDTAMEETQYLSKVASEVILIHRTDKFRARPDLLERISNIPNVTIKKWYTLKEAKGNETLQEVVLQNEQTKEEETLEVQGLFFAIGHTPSTSFLQTLNTGLLDETGYIITNKETMETTVPGLFAAGDVQDKVYRQAITAAYSGMLAGTSAHKWIQESE
ncbi:thioredoxin reductase (NADPH) [Nematocida sp. AWRm80]|nr:thioredoxin reductase (NADPH) [Nematocida sp. AWRm80]